LNTDCFLSLDEAKEKMDTWKAGYNKFLSYFLGETQPFLYIFLNRYYQEE